MSAGRMPGRTAARLIAATLIAAYAPPGATVPAPG
jgi:hypothetical protein